MAIYIYIFIVNDVGKKIFKFNVEYNIIYETYSITKRKHFLGIYVIMK